MFTQYMNFLKHVEMLQCACLHKTVNMVVFLVKSNENTYPKGRALMQMYRVVPIMNRGNLYYKIIKFSFWFISIL